jgi:hypothetical protein
MAKRLSHWCWRAVGDGTRRSDRAHREQPPADSLLCEPGNNGAYHPYFENKIRFPNEANCIWAKAAAPLLNGETVEVRRTILEDGRSTDLHVQIRW